MKELTRVLIEFLKYFRHSCLAFDNTAETTKKFKQWIYRLEEKEMDNIDKRKIAIKIAWHYLGTPGKWGGDDFSGYDCSGFVIELLKSVGLLPSSGDWSADGLMHLFWKKKVDKPYQGCLVFYGKSKATHVEMCINDKLSIGASGVRSTTTSHAEAVKQNAYVKIRTINRRKDILVYLDPFKELK